MIMILDVDVTAEGGIIKLIARKGDTTTLGPKGRQTYEPLGPKGPINPKNLFPQPFYTTCGASRHYHPLHLFHTRILIL